MCEGASRISGPIPPDPTLFPDCYRRPETARGRLEGTHLKLDFLSGPLAPDPTLYPTCYSARPAYPAPRIRPNAREILDRGQSGSVGVLLRLEGISLHGQPQLSPPRKSKDHGKENVRRMREIQKRFREKEIDREQVAPKPIKALWKSSKYETVESKVIAKLQEPPPPPPSSSVPANFLKSHSRCGSGLPPKRPSSPGPSRPPSARDNMEVHGSSIDFVAHNARNAKKVQIRRSRSMQSLNEVLEDKQRHQKEYNSKQKGHLPQYLLDLKQQWLKEKEEMKKQVPDPSMPPGHTKMPEQERLETLSKLKETQTQLTKELLMLPVRADTLSIQNRRTELDKKLTEIEEAIKIFSRPKVFIKIDA
ncbi:PREDICTED: enkurin domain-containing protein 1 [Nanorana parkeri]|uniref:enkurin domain-containing protein 1 n=1 Tax=Nanorana parkeri TaxID=125878 RepID=UPI000854A201|nr:PREDICTED: enkurin domain-containing protein 1 [Nanorana parkeri]